MEDSFRVRVDKAFGSLAAARKEEESLSLSSLWCLTDDEIPRKEWNRDCPDDDLFDSIPYPPNLDGFVFATHNNANTLQTVIPSSSQDRPSSSALHQHFQSDLQDIDDLSEDEDEDPNCKSKRQLGSPNDDDESDIRSSIALDCTLDYEEEEDEYDKVAMGKEKASDRLHMRDAIQYGIDVNTYNELPETLEDFVRDPRADHAAAKLRLKEDAEAAGNFNSLRLSDAEDGSNRKSILKKREDHTEIRTQKRVRFNNDSSDGSLMIQDTYVPDYMRNPSNYTHYTFDDATDMDDDSNRKAYLDFISLVRKQGVQHQQEDMADEYPPKSLTFNPKKMNIDDVHTDKMGIKMGKFSRVGIAVSDDVPDNEVSAMEEDDHGIANIMTKSRRQYRLRTKRDFDDQE